MARDPARGQVLRVRHDQLTTAVYAVPAMWGWVLYSLSPSIPLLRTEQGTSRAVAGLHGTASAIGAITAAALTVAVMRRVGRRGGLVGGSVVAAVGVLLLAVAPSVWFTVPATFVLGLGGSLAFNSVSPVLSDHHHEAAAAAISEANGVAAVIGIVAPLMVGASVALGLTWRGAVLLSVPVALVAIVLVLRVPDSPALHPDPRHVTGDHGPLPRRFWVALVVVTCAVAVEFCLTYWAGDLLRQRTGVAAGTAAALISVLLAGMAVGRLSAARLTAWLGVERLLLASIAVAVLGWALLWAATSVPVAVLGLLVVGLGVALQFPLALARLLRASGGRTDEAAGWATFGAGFASGSAPFALGAVSDSVGPHSGFLLVPAVLVVAAAGVVLAPLRRRTTARAA